jgi:hypothetical protein
MAVKGYSMNFMIGRWMYQVSSFSNYLLGLYIKFHIFKFHEFPYQEMDTQSHLFKDLACSPINMQHTSNLEFFYIIDKEHLHNLASKC